MVGVSVPGQLLLPDDQLSVMELLQAWPVAHLFKGVNCDRTHQK